MHNGCDKCRPSDGKEINWEHLEQIASRKGMTFDDTLYICLGCQGNWFYQRWEEERYDGRVHNGKIQDQGYEYIRNPYNNREFGVWRQWNKDGSKTYHMGKYGPWIDIEIQT